MIETKNADISTLSVTIQALHVGGKQMTIAVFRQLVHADMTDACEPWGFVRYNIKDQGNIWLVHSYSGRLYRMCIPDSGPEGHKDRLVNRTEFVSTMKKRVAEAEDLLAKAGDVYERQLYTQDVKRQRKFLRDAEEEMIAARLIVTGKRIPFD